MPIKVTFERKTTDLHITIETESDHLPLYKRAVNGFFSDLPNDALFRLGFMACQPDAKLHGVKASFERFSFAVNQA